MRIRRKKWTKPYILENMDYVLESIPKINKEIHLEIGMGMGDFICQSAIDNPHIFYIGLEKDETCIARSIKKCKDLNIDNLKFMFVDANKLLDFFQKETIDTIYLHFSDPWPKKGHHKRRLTYNSFLDMYFKILKKDGNIIFKTDNRIFFEDSLVYFDLSLFKLEKICLDFRNDILSKDVPYTGYELKFSNLGQPIFYVKYNKNI